MLINRHQRILASLNDRDFLKAGEVSQMFGVTAMTVWRDFRALEEMGLLRRVRGGVRAVAKPGEQPFESRTLTQLESKQRMAALAVREFVAEGDVVALGGGTTVATIVGFLPRAKISILTNSLPAAALLRSLRPDLPVRVVGGWLNTISNNLVGAEALREVAKLTADVCFIGATGFDADVGPSDPNPMEVELTRAWVDVSRRAVLLLDGSKFGRRASAVTIHPRRLQALVTDQHPPEQIGRLLETHSVSVRVALAKGTSAKIA